MHIAMLSVHSSPLANLGGKEAGGMNVYVRELACELGRRGISVDIFTRRQDTHSAEVIPLAPQVRVFNLLAGPPAPYDKNLLLHHLPAFVSLVCDVARSQPHPYTLLHSHYWVSGEAALMLRQQWQVPVVQMFHTLGALKNRVARSAEETETTQRVAIERRLLREADAVVAATMRDHDQMVQHYDADPAHITVIPGGVDLRQFCPQPMHAARQRLGMSPDERVLLCVGRMEPLKGMDCLIRALAQLLHRHPDWRGGVRVLLVGGHPDTDTEDGSREEWNNEQRRLDTLRTSLGVADAVTFAGAQPHERLPDFYAAADVVAVPSHYESFGLVALEALACGRPVVASDVGGLSYTIEDGQSGLLVPHDTPDALAARIEQVLTDAALRERLAQGARRRAETHGWSHIANQTVRLYQHMLDRAGAAR